MSHDPSEIILIVPMDYKTSHKGQLYIFMMMTMIFMVGNLLNVLMEGDNYLIS